MSETKVKAIVLGNADYKEKDKLVNLFTLEKGIITVVFKSVKSPNAKLKSAKEIFSFGDFIYVEGKFNTVTSADIISTFYDITKDIKKYYTACAILTVVKTVLPVGEVNVALFIDTLKCLNLLANNNINSYYVLNKFLIRIFEGFGYKFTLNACNNCGERFLNHRFMNLTYGDITCFNCKTGIHKEITSGEYSALRILSLTDYDALLTLKLSNGIEKQVFDLLNLYFEKRFGKKLEII